MVSPLGRGGGVSAPPPNTVASREEAPRITTKMSLPDKVTYFFYFFYYRDIGSLHRSVGMDRSIHILSVFYYIFGFTHFCTGTYRTVCAELFFTKVIVVICLFKL